MQSTAGCPGTSDVDFRGDLNPVADLNAEVAYGAFDPMASGPEDRLYPVPDYVPLRCDLSVCNLKVLRGRHIVRVVTDC